MFAVKSSDVLLSIGRGHMDGDIDATMDRLRLLASVDSKSSEARVFYGEIVTLRELLKLHLGLFVLIQHWIGYLLSKDPNMHLMLTMYEIIRSSGKL